MWFYLPKNLNLDEIFEKYDPSGIKGFSKEKAVLVLNQLTLVKARYKYKVMPGGYVPLNAQVMQAYVHNYNDYLNYFITAGVVVKNYYQVGSHSTGYNFHNDYCKPVTTVRIDLPFVYEKKITRFRKKNGLTPEQQKEFSYLTKWYNEDLQIDKEASTQAVYADWLHKMENPKERTYDLRARRYKIPDDQRFSATYSIEALSNFDWNMSIDDFGFRFHTTFSNMSSFIRPFIKYKGQNLVSIDIGNCQPYLSLRLLDRSFYELQKKFSEGAFCDLITIYDLYSVKECKRIINIKRERERKEESKGDTLMLEDSLQCSDMQDVNLYRNLVLENKLYDFLKQEFETRLGKKYAKPKDVKGDVYHLYFSRNEQYGQNYRYYNEKKNRWYVIDTRTKVIFNELFPTVYNIFYRIKSGPDKKDYTLLAKLLQAIESYLVLKVICKRISIERPDVFFTTIHDSICTTEENEAYVTSVMHEELTKAIGYPPTLKRELWNK